MYLQCFCNVFAVSSSTIYTVHCLCCVLAAMTVLHNLMFSANKMNFYFFLWNPVEFNAICAIECLVIKFNDQVQYIKTLSVGSNCNLELVLSQPQCQHFNTFYSFYSGAQHFPIDTTHRSNISVVLNDISSML